MTWLFEDLPPPGPLPPDRPGPPGRRSAILSECGRYRYRLGRSWDDSLPPVNFIMLNPSKADADRDDATIRRCLRFADDWGFGSIDVTNLFAWRATDPRELRRAGDPVGPENDRHTIEAAEGAHQAGGLVVCAWGVLLGPRARRVAVPAMLQAQGIPLHAIEASGAGHPMHPLRLRASCTPVPWSPSEDPSRDD
jgi:hypothetical protein